MAISAESEIVENLKKFSWLNQKDFRYLWFILILKIITSVCLLGVFLGSLARHLLCYAPVCLHSSLLDD